VYDKLTALEDFSIKNELIIINNQIKGNILLYNIIIAVDRVTHSLTHILA
jgi:hypothetical protein